MGSRKVVIVPTVQKGLARFPEQGFVSSNGGSKRTAEKVELRSPNRGESFPATYAVINPPKLCAMDSSLERAQVLPRTSPDQRASQLSFSASFFHGEP